MSCVNFDVCLIAFVMYLLNGAPFSIFVLIRDYCSPLSLDGFPNATTLLYFHLKFFLWLILLIFINMVFVIQVLQINIFCFYLCPNAFGKVYVTFERLSK